MLDSNIANAIQLATYPLTILGVILLVVEVWFKGASERLENWMDAIEDDLKSRASLAVSSTLQFGRESFAEFSKDIMTPSVTAADSFGKSARSLKRISGYLVAYVTWAASFAAFLVSVAIHGTNKITDGHAIGGIGVVLEGICFLGDTYQVAVVLAGA